VKKKGVGAKLGDTLSSNENNSVLKLIRKMKLLFYNESDNPLNRVREARRILSFIESIFNSVATGEIFLYFLDRGAATAWLLQVDLELPEATVYRSLKQLRARGIIVYALKVSRHRGSRGGPRPIVWALQEAHTGDIAHAIRSHQRSLSPKYRVAEELVQTVIKDHLERTPQPEEITHRMILSVIRGHSEPYHTRDIADLAATILREQGIKVWR